MKKTCLPVLILNTSLLWLAFTLLLNNIAYAQQGNVGIFDGHSDVGTGVQPGSARYFPQTQRYVISGAGYNIWNDHDECQFVWKKMKGDFILSARAGFANNKGIEAHRKIGWMVRKSLAGNAAQINAVVHGDGLTSLQFRKTAGDSTEEIQSPLKYADIIQLERKGNTYTMRVAKYGEPFHTEEATIHLDDDVYVGLFVNSHNPAIMETAIFTNVGITVPALENRKDKEEMTLGSNLELLEIATGAREIVYKVPYSIQGPNWTHDGKAIIFNSARGIVYRLDLASHIITPLNTGSVKTITMIMLFPSMANG